MSGEAPIEKRTIHRSPNYPSANLQEAIQWAKMIYEKERRAGAPRDIVLKHMGYNSPNGAALRALATLKKFGLTEERDERIFISPIGLDILVYPNSDERHKKALKESALKPNIYRDVLDRYRGEFPSDETVKAELVREYGFNESVVDSFLLDFYETLRYAELHSDSSSLALRDEMNEGASGNLPLSGTVMAMVKRAPSAMNAPTAYAPAIGSANTFPIPLRKQNQAVISFARMPLDKKDIELLKGWIDLMEENLTEPSEDISDLL